MLHRVIGWALNNPLIVILLGLALLGVGVYSFRNVNVEAYPDPRRPSSRSTRWTPAPPPRRSSAWSPCRWK